MNQISQTSMIVYINSELEKLDQKIDIEFCKKFMFYYDSKEKFPVSIDELVDMKIDTNKGNSKTRLFKYFQKDIDYQLNFAPKHLEASLNNLQQGENLNISKQHGGHNKEYIFLTVECFKAMCMISNNETGNKVRTYYLLLEKIVKSYIETEYSQEIKNLKTELKKSNSKNIALRQEMTVIEKQNYHIKKRHEYHKFKKGPVLYLISDGEHSECVKECNRMKRYKIGFDGKNINRRLGEHRTAIPFTKLEFLIYCENSSLIEKCVLLKFKNKLKPYMNHEWIFNTNLKVITTFISKIIKELNVEYSMEYNIQLYNKSVSKCLDIKKEIDNDIKCEEENDECEEENDECEEENDECEEENDEINDEEEEEEEEDIVFDDEKGIKEGDEINEDDELTKLPENDIYKCIKLIVQDLPDEKRCCTCRKILPFIKFHKCKNNNDGLSKRCVDCIFINNKIYIVEPSDDGLKFCKQCNVEKNTSEFRKNSNRQDGLNHICKDCDKEIEQSISNKPKIAAEYKTCSGCLLTQKTDESFNKRKKSSDGYCGRCKKCTNSYLRERTKRIKNTK
jgi:hypothetical protein